MEVQKTFRFNGFSVSTGRSSMPVGTDAIVLGGWVNVDGVKNILEVGAGSGVISMILASRLGKGTHIDLLDIDEGSILDCGQNIALSGWGKQMFCYQENFLNWDKDGYDLIISNPPYFRNGPVSPIKNRGNARHQHQMSTLQLFEKSQKLLNPEGRLVVIMPYSAKGELLELVSMNFWEIETWAWFRSYEHKPFKRILLSVKKKQGRSEVPAPETITQYLTSDEWHEDYLKIAGGLHHPEYLKLKK